jgi:hypothetical protein
MSVLGRFEKRLERIVEGAFAKVFKGAVHPVELLGSMQREAEAHKAILPGGRMLVPNRYVIELSEADHTRLAPYAAALAPELARSQAEYIGEHGWTVYGDVIVEIDRGKGLDTGRFRVTADVYTGGNVPKLPARSEQSRPGARNARLVAEDGGVYLLAVGPTVVGRSEQANLRLPDIRVSRRHAQIDFDGAGVTVTDLGSSGGTFVNNERAHSVRLNPGDRIRFGATTLLYRID